MVGQLYLFYQAVNFSLITLENSASFVTLTYYIDQVTCQVITL